MNQLLREVKSLKNEFKEIKGQNISIQNPLYFERDLENVRVLVQKNKGNLKRFDERRKQMIEINDEFTLRRQMLLEYRLPPIPKKGELAIKHKVNPWYYPEKRKQLNEYMMKTHGSWHGPAKQVKIPEHMKHYFGMSAQLDEFLFEDQQGGDGVAAYEVYYV